MGFWPVQSGWKHSEVPRFLQNNRKSDAQGFRQWGLSARREYHETKLKNMPGPDTGQKAMLLGVCVGNRSWGWGSVGHWRPGVQLYDFL